MIATAALGGKGGKQRYDAKLNEERLKACRRQEKFWADVVGDQFELHPARI